MTGTGGIWVNTDCVVKHFLLLYKMRLVGWLVVCLCFLVVVLFLLEFPLSSSCSLPFIACLVGWFVGCLDDV